MEINRDNYEECFLLYADNELTDHEKMEVLKFIRENKDLEDEFKTIQDTICKPDDVVMKNKSSLLRTTANDFVTEKNYEEIFVLYHDNELNIEERKSTELFVKDNPHLKKDFDLIARTKITPENLVTYPRKKDLYRKEKDGKVIPIVFWRSLAAAVFIGFGLWIFENYKTQPIIPQTEVVKTESNSSSNKKPNAVSPSIDRINPVSKSKKDSVSNLSIQNQSIAQHEDAEGRKKSLKQMEQAKQQKNSFTQQVAKSNDKPNEPVKEIIAKETPPVEVQHDVASLENDLKNIPENKKIDAGDISFQGDIEIKPNQKNNAELQVATQARQASYVTDGSEKNENYVFYNVTTEEFRKSKVGGFLKKVKRIVERNNPVTRLFAGEDKQVASN